MLNPKANPLLAKVEAAVRAKVAPDQRNAFERIVTAGLRVLDGEQSHQMILSQLKAQADPSDIAGAGVAKLMGILINQSKGSMPMKAGMPAATVLLMEALDRLEALGKIEISNETVSAAMQSMASAVMQMMGVTPQKMDALMKGAQPAQPAAPAQPQTPPSQPSPLIGAPA